MKQNDQLGYRLKSLEILNWGTFNGLYQLNTNTYTALLTGKNGSGKSTLVDALITLIVPQRGTGGRNYNQAAGTSGKERNEMSYVRGAYGQRTDEITGRTQTLYLRDDKSYSVLLAVFDNPTLGKTVTIAIVFWISSGTLSKFHVVADRPLSILDHFRAERDIGHTLKRELHKLDDVEVHDSFTKYSASFTRKLHLGEKAVTLFNQIVSIKDITGLNDFVRQHMLEEYDSQSAIDDLRGYYNNLTVAYEAIEKAEAQLNLLNPLLNLVTRHRDQQERIIQTNRKIDAVEIYISAVQKSFLAKQIEDIRRNIHHTEVNLGTAKQNLDIMRLRRDELTRTIENDNLGQRLQRLETTIQELKRKCDERQNFLNRYEEIAKTLNLTIPQSLAHFQKNQETAKIQLDNIHQQQDEIDKVHIGFEVDIKKLHETGTELESEIKSLKQRKSQIPYQDINIRQHLIDSLNLNGIAVKEETFPFVGELLKVREDFAEWEPAIQRLLGGFGRQLLVPDIYYFAVSEFVEQSNLSGKLVYHRIQTVQTVGDGHLPENALYHRLQIKTDTPFRDWLRAKIIDSFSYICCDSLSSFRRSNRAITINGQVKHGGERHEKDDRYTLGDRSRYILGWENREKVQLLEAELDKLQDKFINLTKRSGGLSAEKRSLANKQNNINQLLFFEAYADLDLSSVSQQLETNRREYESLQTQAEQSQLAQLREHLVQILEEINNADSKKSQLDRELGALEGHLKNQEERIKHVEQTLTRVDLDTMNDLLNEIATDMLEAFDESLSLDNSERAERHLRQIYRKSLDNQNKYLNDLSSDASKVMTNFKNSYPVETQDVDVSLESNVIAWYEDKYNQIHHHDLPRYKTEFEELVRKKVTDSITSFRSGMLNQVQDYRKRIDQLNEALRQIPYTTETYIQLTYHETVDQQIRAFNSDLNHCFPNANVYGDQANRNAYLNVRELIHRLDNESYWAKKVTDIRNWLDFAADERKQSDDSQHEHYDGASGKSGGQKAKLAYTIMASAIAYQYGIFATQRDPNKTFRFVVVDEVFSKSDEGNSRFAMDLFRQLGLQVLVVTPAEKIHIVEPYIGICHWVKNNDEGNDSRVADISIKQLKQTREQLGAAD